MTREPSRDEFPNPATQKESEASGVRGPIEDSDPWVTIDLSSYSAADHLALQLADSVAQAFETHNYSQLVQLTSRINNAFEDESSSGEIKSPIYLANLCNLATAFVLCGDTVAAKNHALNAAIIASTQDPLDVRGAWALNNLSDLYYRIGDIEMARKTTDSLLDRSFSPDQVSLLAVPLALSHRAKGLILYDEGKTEEGKAEVQEGLRLLDKNPGNQCNRQQCYGDLLSELGAMELQQENLDEAFGFYQRALRHLRSAPHGSAILLAPVLANMSQCKLYAREFGEAKALAAESLREYGKLPEQELDETVNAILMEVISDTMLGETPNSDQIVRAVELAKIHLPEGSRHVLEFVQSWAEYFAPQEGHHLDSGMSTLLDTIEDICG